MSELAAAAQKHYTIAEVAKMWHLSPNTVKPMFAGETGIIRFGREESRYKRSNIHIRIPQNVLERVHGRLSTQ